MTYRAIALHSSTGSLSTASAVLLTIKRWRPLEYLHRIVEQSSHKDRLCNG